MITRVFLGLAAVLVVASLGAAGTTRAAQPVTSATIASSTAADFRVAVSATRVSDGGAPSATVNVRGYRKIDGKWASLGSVRIGRPGGFFWKVLTGPRSIRQFSISADSPERATVRLLVTPSLGWSPLYAVHVQGGRLVAG